MTLNVKMSKGIEYLYFQAGQASIYIGPKSDPGKAKPENVIKALEYTWGRMEHYDKSLEELLPFLPPELRDRYKAKEVARLNGRVTRYSRRSARSRR